MMSTSRTRDRACRELARSTRERRQRTLDFADDAERDGQGFAAVFARHDNRLLAANACDEALELEPKWLAGRCLERNALDERLQRQRALRERRQIDVAAKAIELTVAGREVERDVAALLKDANLAHPLLRHAAGGDVRDRARREHDARVRDVDEWRENRNTDGRDVRYLTANEREHEI